MFVEELILLHVRDREKQSITKLYSCTELKMKNSLRNENLVKTKHTFGPLRNSLLYPPKTDSGIQGTIKKIGSYN